MKYSNIIGEKVTASAKLFIRKQKMGAEKPPAIFFFYNGMVYLPNKLSAAAAGHYKCVYLKYILNAETPRMRDGGFVRVNSVCLICRRAAFFFFYFALTHLICN